MYFVDTFSPIGRNRGQMCYLIYGSGFYISVTKIRNLRRFIGFQARVLLGLGKEIGLMTCIFIPLLQRRGWYTVLALSVLPSVHSLSITDIFSHTFFSNHASRPLQTWYSAPALGPTHRLRNSGPPVIYYLFPGSVHFWTLHLGIAGWGSVL